MRSMSITCRYKGSYLFVTLITVTLYVGVHLREYSESFTSFLQFVVPEILCIQKNPKSDNECEDEMEDGNGVYSV